MKIKSKEVLKTLDDKPLMWTDKVEYTIGMALSNILLETKTGGKMKLFLLAQDLYKGKEIEVDNADLVLIKDAVERTEMHNNLVNGQLLMALNKVEEKKKA
jgi:regulator of RNase E activity RraB